MSRAATGIDHCSPCIELLPGEVMCETRRGVGCTRVYKQNLKYLYKFLFLLLLFMQERRRCTLDTSSFGFSHTPYPSFPIYSTSYIALSFSPHISPLYSPNLSFSSASLNTTSTSTDTTDTGVEPLGT